MKTGGLVGDFALGAEAPASSLIISGMISRSARMASGFAVFLLGSLAGAAVAAWFMPPVLNVVTMRSCRH
jgi:hypothetical protein